MAGYVASFVLHDAAIMAGLGDDAIIVIGGVPTQIKAAIDIGIQVGDFVSEYQNQIEIIVNQLPSLPSAGDKIIYDGNTYTLQTRIDGDAVSQRWSMKDG